jgi:Arc/MetJ-type ribon-helix-helix transcriptional regulator
LRINQCVSGLSDKVEKVRVSVTMTKPYLEALDLLVEKGIYLGRGEAILEAIRSLLKGYGVEPFVSKATEP